VTLTNWVEDCRTGNSRRFGGSFFPEAELIPSTRFRLLSMRDSMVKPSRECMTGAMYDTHGLVKGKELLFPPFPP
jgi:hypothetical protein